MPRLDELGALAGLADRQGWQWPADLGDTPLAGLGRPEGVTLGGLGDDPFERAVVNRRRQASPERPLSETFKWLSRRVEGETPLDWAAQAAMFPARTAIRAGTLVGGALLTAGEAEGGPLKAVTSAARTAYDALRPGSKAWRDAPYPDAPFPQYAEQYPSVGPPTMMPKEKPRFRGEMYPEKTLTPEAEAFAEERVRIQREMKKEGFHPYFDPEQRFSVDPGKYPARDVDTLTLGPKTLDTIIQYLKVIDTPETAARLNAAIARGEKLGNADRWYQMGQLEREYINVYGPKQGRAAFLDEFARPMAATTSGQKPTPNLMTAHYFEYLRKKGLPLPEGHQLPYPVGGRRPETNITSYQQMRERQAAGEPAITADQPKMYDFHRSYIGDLSRPVMDENMAKIIANPVWEAKARSSAYGLLQRPVMREAAKRSVEPGALQDVAWAGIQNQPGMPMIQHASEAVERTHRLTGMARSEIVRRALIKKEIPLYVATALIGNEALRGVLDNPTAE